MQSRIAFFGTCQLVHLANLLSHLPGWTDQYVSDRILRVDTLTQEQYRHFLVNCETADILCVQPVQAEHFYEARTECVLEYARRHGKRVIIVPYVYFSGYTPHIIYAHTKYGRIPLRRQRVLSGGGTGHHARAADRGGLPPQAAGILFAKRRRFP